MFPPTLKIFDSTSHHSFILVLLISLASLSNFDITELLSARYCRTLLRKELFDLVPRNHITLHLCPFYQQKFRQFSYHKTGTVPLVIHRSKRRKFTCRSPNQATYRRTIAHLPDNERFWPINRPTRPVKVFIEHIRYPLGPSFN